MTNTRPICGLRNTTHLSLSLISLSLSLSLCLTFGAMTGLTGAHMSMSVSADDAREYDLTNVVGVATAPGVARCAGVE